MFIFDNPYRPPDPEMQAIRNRQFMFEREKEYRIFCNQLLKSVDTHTNNISIEYMDNEQKTCGYSVVNFLLEYISERNFYYSLKFQLNVYHLKNIGNPIFQVYKRFIKDCKEIDPLRMAP